jgi:hypothetical protein
VSTTRPERRPVDIELLADYLAGLLDAGRAAEVRHRVDTDPEWAATAAILGDADRAVTETLASTPYGRESMPADVAASIAMALRAERSQAEGLQAEGSRSEPPPGRSNVVPITGARPSRARRLARNGWLRAAAAIIVILGSVSLLAQLPAQSSKSASTSGAGGALAAPYAARPLPTLAGVTITSTGIDYFTHSGAFTLSPGVPRPTRGINGPDLAHSPTDEPAVPEDLRRLSSADALTACLTAVRASVGGTVTSVDFARYDTAPALIITLTPSGTVIAVGSDCGLPGSGSDTIAKIGHS